MMIMMDNKINKNTMKKFILIPITLLVLILASCSNSDDIIETYDTSITDYIDISEPAWTATTFSFRVTNRSSEDVKLVSWQSTGDTPHYVWVTIHAHSSKQGTCEINKINISDILFTFKYNGKLYTKNYNPFK